MFRLEKTFVFEAAHHLPFHDGRCKRVHGHSWVGRIVCEGERLQSGGPKSGMLLDYGTMKEALQPLLDNYLDHWDLNESIPELEEPTSERIAAWIYRMLKPDLALLVEVIIEETCSCRCVYRPSTSNPSRSE